MPWLSSYPCRYPGCGVLLRGKGGYCSGCRPKVRRRQELGRPSSCRRGYGYNWRKRRAEYLRDNPTCVRCGDDSTEVDHIIPLSAGGLDDESNWQALCKSCHSVKTGKQDRRGRGIKSLEPSRLTGRAGTRVRPHVMKRGHS